MWAVAVALTALVVAPPAQAATAPFMFSAVAWTHSTVIVAAVDSAGDLYYWGQQDGATGWNHQQVAAG
jgi:hypothetical protein